MDPSGRGAKRGCWGSDEDSPDPAEDEGAAPKVDEVATDHKKSGPCDSAGLNAQKEKKKKAIKLGLPKEKGYSADSS
ncbi:unnamed protein product [Heligmosomoides polygyrus]|uniref:Ankyrin repeat domain-containing protein 11 n=1 Tax=Heligmosomoides polygyrus TaxID=6339 RepID=A0A183GAE3_HELPZ|nr:unnamed protein product [Heligmosomoides polygyrus]